MAITKDFFDKVWYNFYDLIDYVDYDNALRNDEDISNFLDFVVKNEVLFVIEYDDKEILSIVANTDKHIVNVLEKLSDADVVFDAYEASEAQDDNIDEPIQ